MRLDKAKPGTYLAQQLVKYPDLQSITTLDFLQALLATKKPCIFAETGITGGGVDWNYPELSILGDINVAMKVNVFDNGVWSPSDPDFKAYDPVKPLEAHLLFTPGALLQFNGDGEPIVPDGYDAIDAKGNIDKAGYAALVERRLLPLLVYAENTAAAENKCAVVVLPGLGCGAFAGKFRGQMAAHLDTALQELLSKSADALPHIQAVVFDPHMEEIDSSHNFAKLSYKVRPARLHPRQSQLAHPGIYAHAHEDYSDCMLFKVVAWDHVSLPGNDYFAGSRFTDDGVAAAATDSMRVITGISSVYRNGGYQPPSGYKNWEDVANKAGTTLEVTASNLKVLSPVRLPLRQRAPKPPGQ